VIQDAYVLTIPPPSIVVLCRDGGFEIAVPWSKRLVVSEGRR